MSHDTIFAICFSSYLVGVAAWLIAGRLGDLWRLRTHGASSWWMLSELGGAVAMIWPAALAGVGLMWAIRVLDDDVFRRVVDGAVKRRERVALAEREAKRIADEARLAVERGPHR
jgi:hypothetical protein